jgi:hypothetical protein
MTLDAIAALWAQEPSLPLSTIASELGATRGAIAGQIARARRKGDPRFGLRPPGNQHTAPRDAESDRKPRPAPVVAEPQGSPPTAKSSPEAVEEPKVVESRPGGSRAAANGVLEPAPIKAAAPVRCEGGVSLVDLPRDGCRYPVNESGPIRFCGARCDFGKSWCACHAAIVRSGVGVSGARTFRAPFPAGRAP